MATIPVAMRMTVVSAAQVGDRGVDDGPDGAGESLVRDPADDRVDPGVDREAGRAGTR